MNRPNGACTYTLDVCVRSNAEIERNSNERPTRVLRPTTLGRRSIEVQTIVENRGQRHFGRDRQ